MEHCKVCMKSSLDYQIRFIGQENNQHLPQIITYLKLNDLLVKDRNEILIVKETAVAGMIDYFNDNMNTEHIFFRVDQNEWRPINEATELLDFQWIDKVIFEELVNFHIQPIVDTDEQIYAHEMLARFNDDKGDSIGPYQVFVAAKKRNRTYALDRICRMAAVRNAVSIDTKAFINFIPTSIYSPEHCLKSTVELANQLGIKSSQFVFEVVETEQVKDLDHLKTILMYYREKGFQYALDDVGEGFSTIEVLKELSPHYMKLDMKFVQGVSSDSQKQKAAIRILQAALEIGSIPLAEGVEERDDFIWLKNNGFKLFQGYLFGKPMPITRKQVSTT